MDKSYVSRAYNMPKWNAESHEGMYERFYMGGIAKGENYGVDEWVQYGTVRQF